MSRPAPTNNLAKLAIITACLIVGFGAGVLYDHGRVNTAAQVSPMSTPYIAATPYTATTPTPTTVSTPSKICGCPMIPAGSNPSSVCHC